MARLSSLDDTYITGDLSAFSSNPRTALTDAATVDSEDTLYKVSNNAETKLVTGLTYNGKMILVEDASKFPEKGLVRVGAGPGSPKAAELIYYGSRTNNSFKDLVRGFAGSRQNQWPSGSNATNSVCAEPHNAVKDAILNIENKIGVKDTPAIDSLNQRLKSLEARFLAPKCSFRAYPKSGSPSLTVRFQNFSEGDVVRYLWDFGDGTQSIEKSPTHTYNKEGIYTVKLNTITSSGAQGIATKNNYIKVSFDEINSFFYPSPATGISRKTAIELGYSPTEFTFVDQTDGDIKQRIWIFSDGSESVVQDDPNVHQITHTFENPGIYDPSLLVVFANTNIRRIFLSNKVVVS
jgi:PKD repeat protein